MFFNCFCLFFKRFSQRGTSKFSLFYYLFLIKRNGSSPVRYSYFSIFPDDRGDIFPASLLKPKGLSDGKVVSLTKKELFYTGQVL